MNGLKALIEKRKRAAQEAAQKQAQQQADAQPSEKRARTSSPSAPAAGSPGSAPTKSTSAVDDAAKALNRSRSDEAAAEVDLSDAEVRRRLRRLDQPVTLFGEVHLDRKKRLLRAEATLHVVDAGAEQGDAEGANVLIDIQKEARREAARAEEARRAASAAAGSSAPGPRPASADKASAHGSVAQAPGADAQDDANAQLMRQFQDAAERLRQQQQSPEERIVSKLMSYMDAWKADLDARPPELANTTIGLQATNGYRQTARAFQTLYERLRKDEVHKEIVSSLLIIIDAIENRNYLHANNIYLQLSIGNQQWPIGVTSIGIHERKAREKLSTYANPKSQAHIMNDEATRKYLHGVSRIVKAMQGLFPTDPSRSVNFNAVQHGGLGVKVGNQKEELLRLKEAGEGPHQQLYKPAPHHLAGDGSVNVPTTWGNMLKANPAK